MVVVRNLQNISNKCFTSSYSYFLFSGYWTERPQLPVGEEGEWGGPGGLQGRSQRDERQVGEGQDGGDGEGPEGRGRGWGVRGRFCKHGVDVRGHGATREKGIVEWILIHFSEARGRILFCGHVDPAFLFSSQDSTKIQGLERPFKTRITGFYWLYKWIR